MNGARGKGREAVEESVKMSDEDILVVAKQSPRNLDVVFCVCGGLCMKNNCHDKKEISGVQIQYQLEARSLIVSPRLYDD